jgi:hypothetical protein
MDSSGSGLFFNSILSSSFMLLGCEYDSYREFNFVFCWNAVVCKPAASKLNRPQGMKLEIYRAAIRRHASNLVFSEDNKQTNPAALLPAASVAPQISHITNAMPLSPV